MKVDIRDIKKIFDPNPDFRVVEKTFVDVGNLETLKENYLYEPKSFLLIGDYGSGKTSLLKVLEEETLIYYAQKFNNIPLLKTFHLDLSDRKIKILSPSLLQLTVLINVKSFDNQDLQKASFISDIMLGMINQMLIVSQFTRKEYFKSNKELLKMRNILLGVELTKEKQKGKKAGLDYGLVLEGEDTTIQRSSIKTENLLHYYKLLEDLLRLLKENDTRNPHFIILLDDFEKLDKKRGEDLLKSHQGILFEKFRKYCSFVISCKPIEAKFYSGDQFSWLYNDVPFEIKKFNVKHAKELIEKRLIFYKQELKFEDIVKESTLKEIVDESKHVPRSILIKTRDRMLSNNCNIPI